MALVMGIDVGTQSLRACLFDLEGNLVGKASVDYPTYRPREGWVEQDPDDWREALFSAASRVVLTTRVKPEEVRAVSYGCTSCTVLPLDENGRALRPALLWMDERAWREAERVTRLNHPVLRYTGNAESPQWMIPKAMWLAENEPTTFTRTRWLVEQTDYITFLLTGRFTASMSNAVAKWHFAPSLGGWPTDLLERLRFGRLLQKWPTEVLPVGTVLGPVSSNFADATGLTTRTLVVQGGVDAHAAMVGMGALEEGDMALVIGTSTCHMAQSSVPVFADIWGPYPEAVAKGVYTLGGGQSTTGSIMQWIVENFAPKGVSYADMDRLASAIPPGSEGLVALDFFQGNRTPFKDPRARGAIWGLTLRHGLPHIFRAFYEAVAYGTLAILENLEQHGYTVKRLLAGGGGAKSRLWMQIHADVTGRPVVLAVTDEPTALGAAIWAGIGAGLFQGYQDAISHMVRHGETLTPCLENREAYEFYYRQYLDTYQQLKPLMHSVVEFETARPRTRDQHDTVRA